MIYDMHMEFWIISLLGSSWPRWLLHNGVDHTGPPSHDGVFCFSGTVRHGQVVLVEWVPFGLGVYWQLAPFSFVCITSRDTPLHNMYVVVRLWTLICH
jgi:hypothetical protein